jgi:hypothetical protein
MKLFITKNTYKASNVSLTVSDDLERAEAYSYQWWRFVATDSVGNIVFNHYKYSVSTGKHQRDVASLLDRLGVQVNLHLYNTGLSLDDLKDAITDEIKGLERQNVLLRDAIACKGSRKAKNVERLKTIEHIQYRIKDLARYRDEHIDTKAIPVSRGTRETDPWVAEQHKTYERYFLKPNGVLKRNEFQVFIQQLNHWKDAPTSIDNIKNLLNLKTLDQISTVLRYEYAADLNNQIPHVDSESYQTVLSCIKKLGITTDTITVLSLDKLHTALTNLENRRDYVPSEPNLLPVSPILASLKGVDALEVIDTDRKLRAEGRKQNHCIGGKHYLDRCRNGYQALNYKGYTFFLSPDLSLVETKGRHNSYTPESVVRELLSYIREASTETLERTSA